MKYILIDLDVCFECGAPKEHMHHIIPRIRDGVKTIPLCFECHGRVHDLSFKGTHSILIKEGVKKKKDLAQSMGLPNPYLGREKDTIEPPEKFLSKHQDIIECLNNKLSLRVSAKKTNKALGTVQKVKAIMTAMQNESIE